MIVVADSSPLHYLILLGQAELLHRLYAEVVIPDAVAAELRAAQSPPRSERVVVESTFVAPRGSSDSPGDRIRPRIPRPRRAGRHRPRRTSAGGSPFDRRERRPSGGPTAKHSHDWNPG